MPSLKKIQDITSKMGIKIDSFHIKNFFERLQNINFEEIGPNDKKQDDSTKKEKSIIIHKTSLLNKNNNRDNEENTNKKNNRLKNKNRWLTFICQIFKISVLIAIVISTIIMSYYSALCIRDREVLEDRLARYKDSMFLEYMLRLSLNKKQQKQEFYNIKLEEAKKIRKKTWGFFGRFIDFCTRVLIKKSAYDSVPLLIPPKPLYTK